MNPSDLAAELNKIKYQLHVVSKTIDYDIHPVEALILSMNWAEGDIERAHDIFEKCDNKLQNKEEVNWSAFEHELRNTFGIDYQTVKNIILAFYKNHQWTNVCYGYAMSFEPSTPIEFHQITRRSDRF